MVDKGDRGIIRANTIKNMLDMDRRDGMPEDSMDFREDSRATSEAALRNYARPGKKEFARASSSKKSKRGRGR